MSLPDACGNLHIVALTIYSLKSIPLAGSLTPAGSFYQSERQLLADCSGPLSQAAPCLDLERQKIAFEVGNGVPGVYGYYQGKPLGGLGTILRLQPVAPVFRHLWRH